MPKKNILILTTTFPSKKDDIISARFVFDLARSLTPYYNVHVLAPSSPGAKDAEEMDGITVHRFIYFIPSSLQLLTTGEGIFTNLKKNPFLFMQLPFLLISELICAIYIIKKEKIEVVNSHWIIPQGLIVAFIKKALCIKHILTVHAADIFTLKRWGFIGRVLAEYIVKRSDKIIAVSNYIKSVIDELVEKEYDFTVMPMGVRVDVFDGKGLSGYNTGKGAADKSLKILFVGKMTEKKGLKFLLEALSIIKNKNRSFKLDIIGGGFLESPLKSYASRLGLEGDVHFYGWIANYRLPDFYKNCDIVAVPSIFDKKGETEGMPVVVLEAMAMSRPVLGSRISGIPDIVTEGYNGWLTEPSNAKQIADKIESIYDLNKDIYKENAYRTAEKFSYEKVAVKYKEVIG